MIKLELILTEENRLKACEALLEAAQALYEDAEAGRGQTPTAFGVQNSGYYLDIRFTEERSFKPGDRVKRSPQVYGEYGSLPYTLLKNETFTVKAFYPPLGHHAQGHVTLEELAMSSFLVPVVFLELVRDEQAPTEERTDHGANV